MSVNLGTLEAHIGGNTRDLDMALGRSRRKINAFAAGASRSFAGLNAGAVALGGAFAALGVTVGGGMIVRQLTSIGTSFEQTMTTAAAVMRASAEEAASLNAIAREMGETTEWTATQSGEALKFLGMAGFNAAKSITALPGTLDLATAGGIELGRAADIATNALTAMGLPVKELGRVNDVFVGTITRSNTNMEMMAESFKYAAPLARAYGYSVEELSGLIGQLGNAGVQSSMAGTQLAMAFVEAKKIAREFGFESSDLLDVISSLRDRFGDNVDMMDHFSKRAGRAALILDKAGDSTREFQETLLGVGGEAEALADKMRSTLGGAFKELKSVVESVGIDVFDTYRDNMLRMVKDTIRWFREHKDGIVAVAEEIVVAFENVGRVASILWETLGAFPKAVLDYFESVRKESEKTRQDLLRDQMLLQAGWEPPPLSPWEEYVMEIEKNIGNMIAAIKYQASMLGTVFASLIFQFKNFVVGMIDIVHSAAQVFASAIEDAFMSDDPFVWLFKGDKSRSWAWVADVDRAFVDMWNSITKGGEASYDALEKANDDYVRSVETRSAAKIWADQWTEEVDRVRQKMKMQETGAFHAAFDEDLYAALGMPPQEAVTFSRKKGYGKDVGGGEVDAGGEDVDKAIRDRMTLLRDEAALFENLFESKTLSQEKLADGLVRYNDIMVELIQGESNMLAEKGRDVDLVVDTAKMRLRELSKYIKNVFEPDEEDVALKDRVGLLKREQQLYEDLFRAKAFSEKELASAMEQYSAIRIELIGAEEDALLALGVAGALVADVSLQRESDLAAALKNIRTSLDETLAETKDEMGGWAADVSRDMAHSFETFFFDVMKGEFDDLSDYARAFGDVALRSSARAVAEGMGDIFVDAFTEEPGASLAVTKGGASTEGMGKTGFGGTEIHLHGVADYSSFNRNEKQFAAKAFMIAQRANRRLN